MTMTTDRALRLLAWVAALWIAYEFLVYLQYKLPGPTLVFDRLSAWSGIPEKPFRLFVAGMETVAAVLVLIPRTRVIGAAFAMGIMSGAILFHLFTPLGVLHLAGRRLHPVRPSGGGAGAGPAHCAAGRAAGGLTA
jgi:uncharacterized membrane protein YphA (DoxX/SURF4 family)